MHITVSKALTLGLVQGLTEFLPVSSSAHLVIFQHLFNLKEPMVFFDVCLHLGTLAAVVLFLKKDLKSIIYESFHLFLPSNGTTFKERWVSSPSARLAFLIAVATIPTGFLGVFFNKNFEALFNSVVAVGLMLIVTGFVLYLTKGVKMAEMRTREVNILDAVIIGTVQGLAIAPGISRSGTTISFGIFRGIEREMAARFSFLLSIPAVMGAAIIKFTHHPSIGNDIPAYLAGSVVAVVTGYLSLKLLSAMIRRGHLYYFAPYCIVVGCLCILASAI